MDKNVIIFIIKLFGTFAVLSIIIILGKHLKSVHALNEKVSYNPMYESVSEVQQMRDEIELRIRLDNEKRAEIINKTR